MMSNETRVTRQKVTNIGQCAGQFIWPIGKSPIPDEMNTSYGPRIDADRWDFHDGIDLPADLGTPAHAMANGVVHRAGPADKTEPGKGFGSTHVLLKVVDPTDGKDDLFLVYLHLDSIAQAVLQGAHINKGDLIGTVGQEDATYPHLHFEFRKGGADEESSVHPLNYLPYENEFNFTQPEIDRVNFYADDGEKRAVRIFFENEARQEGDLRGVDLRLSGPGAQTRSLHVDFDDRQTINSDKGDDAAFKNGIAVEGYQKSNLKGEKLDDLNYGVIVNGIGPEFEVLELQVLDAKNANSESVELDLPTLQPGETRVNKSEGFEGQTFPPLGWKLNVLSGNVCRPDKVAALTGQRGLLCKDLGSLAGQLIRAGLRFALPAQRMSWRLRSDLSPAKLEMSKGQVIHPLAFMASDRLVAAACLRKITDDEFVAGVSISSGDGFFRERIDVSEGVVLPNKSLRWELELLRIGTRQTTAVLRLGNNVVARINGDTRDVEPNQAFAGIMHEYGDLQITLHFDQIFLTETPRF